MSIRVALHHSTSYTYDRPVTLGPQIVRLRPAAHCRTPILSYSLTVTPKEHYVNWQQDPFGNFQARFDFPEPVTGFKVETAVVADLAVINPFEFFVEEDAETFPFQYHDDLARDLVPYLETAEWGKTYDDYVAKIDRTPRRTVDFLVDLNRRLQEDIGYVVRMEPGVQRPDETLSLKTGSCRDSSWLLVQMLRDSGIAARFVSGYLIQLKPDVESLDGPSGTDKDFTDLHAWAEAYVPGAGWIGLDPTSGLLAGEGHIPLACTPEPGTAAPISGLVSEAEVEFGFEMSVQRVHEDPRVTKPYSEEEWAAIDALGNLVERRLREGDVRLTMGGEPTFVSIDDMDSEEWTIAAVGEDKLRLSETLIRRLRERFAPQGLLHFGQGKWYPGESLPRWALTCLWRNDGEAIWTDPDLIASPDDNAEHETGDAESFAQALAENLGVETKYVQPAYEDTAHHLLAENRLPINVDPSDSKLDDPEERARMARVFDKGLGTPSGFVLPLRRQWWQAKAGWVSELWRTRTGRLMLLPGDSPVGLRLPIDQLPWAPAAQRYRVVPRDPTMPVGPLPSRAELAKQLSVRRRPEEAPGPEINEQVAPQTDPNAEPGATELHVHTALCVEVRDGALHVFLPPVEAFDDYADLVFSIEQTAAELKLPAVIDGYLPPPDPRVNMIKVTPDPGVIEVNVHPGHSWQELVSNTTALYEEARLSRLGTEKFDLDGQHTGTGGGNHVVLGGAKPLDSPFLRRPDLLRSFIGYWNNHPALSYLFSSRFIGPTSQAPRLDEGRKDALYEMAIAFSEVPDRNEESPPWIVDRVFRHLLVDLTGNTHRAEICIDKLYSPDSATGRLGLVELRAFEMPPHARMSLAQQLLVRALVVKFWETPYSGELIDWGTGLHDRFLLPHFVWRDLAAITRDLEDAGIPMKADWFKPHFEFRFLHIGTVEIDGATMELRTAGEPWYVLGEEPAGGGTARYVDSSVERLQLKLYGLDEDRYAIACNGVGVPLTSTGVPGEYVAGVRFRAWQPPSCLHPTIPVHSPLTFDVIDRANEVAIGGCGYHVSHPAGRNPEDFPINANAAEARRRSRFAPNMHTPGRITAPNIQRSSECPLTLDLRRAR